MATTENKPSFLIDLIKGTIPFMASYWMLNRETLPRIEKIVWAGAFALLEVATWVIPVLRVLAVERIEPTSLFYLAAGKGVEGIIFAVSHQAMYSDDNIDYRS